MKQKFFSIFVIFGLVVIASISAQAQGYLVDDSFNPTFGGRTHPVYQFNNVVVVQPDQKILVGGNFTTVNEASSPLIVRLNPDGSRDTTFNTPLTAIANDVVGKIKLLPDGKMLVAGIFRVSGNPTYFVKLNANGSLDESFSAGVVGGISDIETYADGKFMACGGFSVNGSSPSLLARFNQDGTRDMSFQANLTGNGCRDVEILPDGRMFAGGRISGMNGVAVGGLVKLNSDGSRDTTFNTPPESYNVILLEISRLALQPNGNLLASYRVETFDNSWSGINLYTPTGAYQPFYSCTVYSTSPSEFIYLQEDGRIVTSGCVSPSTPSAYFSFARLLPDGAFDTSLNHLDFNGVIPQNIDRQADGKYLVVGYFNSVNGIPRQRIVRLRQNLEPARRRFDFDGDGKSDISVFRPSNGAWYLNQSTAGFTGSIFGLSNDKLVPADYDGDGKTDVAVFRNGVWYLQRSQLGFTGINFGDGNDVPVPADYDGDGKTDVAVFRPSNGYWYILNSGNYQFIATLFGISTDKLIPGDYDGDGKADIAVNRNGNWYIQRSQAGFISIQFGDSNDKLVPADYDGDGKIDVAVFRPSNGTWYLQQSTAGFTGIAFGLGTDIPVAADYDGDGKTDIAVVRNGNWYLNRTIAGFAGIQFGTSTDLPVPNAFVK